MSSPKNARKVPAAEVWRSPVHILAFWFGSGLSPRGPGTAGTVAAIPLWLLLRGLPLPADFAEVIRHGFRGGFGVKIDSGDVEAFLGSVLQRRRGVAERSFATDLVDGTWLWINETVLGSGWLLSVLSDVTALKQEERVLRQARDTAMAESHTDPLTGLANRRWFFAELTKLHEQSKATGGAFAIGIIDLDGFKPVNDTFGHMTGDRVLTEAAQRLKEACGDDIILARLGGDEFGFILSGSPTRDELRWLGAAISDIIRLPYAVGSSQALLGSSIGVAGYPQSANDPQALFERADYALYHAKRHQRGQMVIFSTEHEEQIRSHSVIEQALQNADLDAELSMVFQPIVDITTGRVRAFEALARWQSPTLGHVSPDRFIPVAERAGHVRGVTKTLLKKALAALAQWPADIRMSFNLSAHDLSDSETVVQIIAIINRSRVDPKRIDFEITETAVAHDFKQAQVAVQTLKALGAGISLDDFGTGYSSLSHVHRLPLDKIKVDRSFITDIGSNPVSLKIVKSLTALCADMGLDCIIEGVETSAQLATLRDLGCRMVQGYYFAKPMTEAEVPEYLASAEEKRA